MSKQSRLHLFETKHSISDQVLNDNSSEVLSSPILNPLIREINNEVRTIGPDTHITSSKNTPNRVNEDACAKIELVDGSKFVVLCDGMGGMGRPGSGADCSAAIVNKFYQDAEAIASSLKSMTDEVEMKKFIDCKLTHITNQQIFDVQFIEAQDGNASPSYPGSTFTFCFELEPNKYFYYSIGDSAIVVQSNDSTKKLTTEESFGNYLDLTEGDKSKFDESFFNNLINGVSQDTMILETFDDDPFKNYGIVELNQGESISLMSDGISDNFNLDLIHQTPVPDIVDMVKDQKVPLNLTPEGYKRYKPDDISIVSVDYTEAEKKSTDDMLFSFLEKLVDGSYKLDTFEQSVENLYDQRMGKKKSWKRKLKNFWYKKSSKFSFIGKTALSLGVSALFANSAFPMLIMTILFRALSASNISNFILRKQMLEDLNREDLNTEAVKLHYKIHREVGDFDFNILKEFYTENLTDNLDSIKSTFETLSKEMNSKKSWQHLGSWAAALGMGAFAGQTISWIDSMTGFSDYLPDFLKSPTVDSEFSTNTDLDSSHAMSYESIPDLPVSDYVEQSFQSSFANCLSTSEFNSSSFNACMLSSYETNFNNCVESYVIPSLGNFNLPVIDESSLDSCFNLDNLYTSVSDEIADSIEIESSIEVPAVLFDISGADISTANSLLSENIVSSGTHLDAGVDLMSDNFIVNTESSSLLVRNEAGAVIDSFAKGASVEVLSSDLETTFVNNVEMAYVKVKAPDGTIGFVSANYLKKV